MMFLKHNVFFKVMFSYLFSLMLMIDGDDGGGSDDGDGDTFDNMEIDSIGSEDGVGGTGKVKHEDDKPIPGEGDKIPGSVDNKQVRDADNKIPKKQSKEEPTEEEVIEFLKAKYEDSEYDIHPDAVFTIGEGEDALEVSMNDLYNNYMSLEELEAERNSHNTQLSEFDFNRRQFQSDIENSRLIQSQYNNIKELANNPDTMVDSFYSLFDSLGLNSNNVYEALVGEIFPDLDKAFMEMDEPEFRNYMLQRQTNFMSKFQNAQTQRIATERQRYEMGNKISSVKKQHGVSDEGYRDAYDALLKLQEQGNLKVELNPENIGKKALQLYVDKTASGLLEAIQPGLSGDGEILNTLVEIMDEQRFLLGRDFTNEELNEYAEVVIDAYQLGVEEIKGKKGVGSGKKVTTKKKQQYEDDTFDDLEERLYK